MSIEYRFRNIVIAAALAAAAVLLTVVYVSTARDNDAAQKESVTVYVPSRSFSVGTAGSKIAGSLEATKVARSAMAPKAVTDPAQIQELYTTEAVYSGEQLSLNRFVSANKQGVLAKLKGNQRAVQVSGDTDQTLAGTLQPGDRVDVLANVKNPANANDVRSLVALRNLRVLLTQDGEGSNIDNQDDRASAVILALTDEQAQRLNWVVTNGEWKLQLRPVKKPKDGNARPATFAIVTKGDR
jgi:Flp pilus assembly protein CpaB